MKFSFLKFIGTRVVTLYLVLFCVGYMLLDREKYQEGVMVRTLNDMMPESYTHLIDVSYGIVPLDQEQWQKYSNYYEKVVQFNPDMTEAYGVLGFCYYQLGDYERTIVAYKKAISLNKYFFWFPYNLGIIYLKTGQYNQARESFKAAMATRPEHALLFIQSSKWIYPPIIGALVKNFRVSITEQLKMAYYDCKRLLILTEKSISSSEKISEDIINKLEVKPY